MTSTLPAATPAGQLREAMVRSLRADGHLTSAAAEAAFLAVPREILAPPGTELKTLYDVYQAVVTKRRPDGRAVSSISAPSIQAFMIEQADLRPGMKILECGSGGVNAAYLAKIVGPTGRVVTIDIDPEVTDRTAAYLDAAGCGSRVRVLVLQGDAHHGVLDEAPFDVIMVTVQCFDAAPAWWQQLLPGGVLVAPFTFNGGVSRSIAFRRDGDRWISRDAKMCGFVGMQGIGAHSSHRVALTAGENIEVTAEFDHPIPPELQLDYDLLSKPAVEVWSGVSYPHKTSWENLYLYFACYLGGLCYLSTPDGRSYPGPKTGGLPYATARGGSLAHLIHRPLDNPDEGIEFGARGFGDDGQHTAQAIIDLVRAWDAGPRHVVPWFSYVSHQEPPVEPRQHTVPFARAGGSILVHWPAGS